MPRHTRIVPKRTISIDAPTGRTLRRHVEETIALHARRCDELDAELRRISAERKWHALRASEARDLRQHLTDATELVVAS